MLRKEPSSSGLVAARPGPLAPVGWDGSEAAGVPSALSCTCPRPRLSDNSSFLGFSLCLMSLPQSPLSCFLESPPNKTLELDFSFEDLLLAESKPRQHVRSLCFG